MKSTLLAAALALCAANVSAQAIYTSVSLDGHKTFSDRADTNPDPVAEAADAPKPARRRTFVSSRLSASVNAQEAQRRLAQTKQTRKQGLTPLPGESVPVPGGLAVNTRYWSRQERLRLDVERAQRRANEMNQLQLARQ